MNRIQLVLNVRGLINTYFYNSGKMYRDTQQQVPCLDNMPTSSGSKLGVFSFVMPSFVNLLILLELGLYT